MQIVQQNVISSQAGNVFCLFYQLNDEICLIFCQIISTTFQGSRIEKRQLSITQVKFFTIRHVLPAQNV